MSAPLAIDGKPMLFDVLLPDGIWTSLLAKHLNENTPMSAPLAIDGKPMLFDVLLPDGVWTSLLAKHLKLERTDERAAGDRWKAHAFRCAAAGRRLDVIAGKTPQAGAHPMSAPLAIDGKPMLFDVLLPDGIWTVAGGRLKLERTRSSAAIWKARAFDVLLPDGIWASWLARRLKLERTR